jgi:hypothetical protein
VGSGRCQRILVDYRDHDRGPTTEPGEAILDKHFAESGDEIGAYQGTEVVVPADQGNLADDCLDPAVDRTDH